jgi:hypothetical protein
VHISDSVCLTDGADDPDKSCVFPFEFYGTIYNECTWEAAYIYLKGETNLFQKTIDLWH